VGLLAVVYLIWESLTGSSDYVPDNYTTIQEALNATSLFETTIIRDSTYNSEGKFRFWEKINYTFKVTRDDKGYGKSD